MAQEELRQISLTICDWQDKDIIDAYQRIIREPGVELKCEDTIWGLLLYAYRNIRKCGCSSKISTWHADEHMSVEHVKQPKTTSWKDIAYPDWTSNLKFHTTRQRTVFANDWLRNRCRAFSTSLKWTRWTLRGCYMLLRKPMRCI
jgi:hypothetical protein